MKIVKLLSQVDQVRCNGDKLCQRVCPSGAIKVIKKKATVDEKKCLACSKCWDVCPNEAIRMVPRSKPITFGLDPAEVNQTQLRELCARAHLSPEQPVCPCSGTRAKEVAAAVLKGAKTSEDIALMTGVLSGCTMLCIEPIVRLFEAQGVKIPLKEGRPLPNLWNIPEEVKQKYPGSFFEEDRKMFESAMQGVAG